MIIYLSHSQIDKEKWDNCIRSAYNGNIYAFSWYLDIISPSWDALISDDYTSVFPLTWKRKFGIKYIYRPYLIQNLGLYSKTFLDIDVLEQFLQKIPNEFKFIDLYFNKYNKIDKSKHSVFENITYELDLIQSYKNLYRNYSSNTKRNIKKAQQANIQIVASIKPQDLVSLFRANKGKNLHNLGENEYSNLNKLCYLLISKGMLHIRAAYTQKNELCAGVFFAKSHQKVIFLFSATNEYARNNGVMSLIIDQFIKENAQKNITLDFEGSNIENLARFYRSFGSKEYVYLQIKKNSLPFGIKQLAYAYQKFRLLIH